MIKIYTIIFTLLISANALAQLTDGLVLKYDLNGDAFDNSLNGNHGVLINTSPTLDVYCNEDSALYFNGAASIIIPNNPSIKPQLPITLSMYVKLDNLNNVQPLYFSDAVPNDYAGFFINVGTTGQIMAHIGSHNGIQGYQNRRSFLSDKTISINDWYSITVIINSYNNMRIFIDCTESSGTYSGTGDTTVVYTNYEGRIGARPSIENYPDGLFLKGAIDEVLLWDRALTESEIQELCSGACTVGQSMVQLDIEGCDNNDIISASTLAYSTIPVEITLQQFQNEGGAAKTDCNFTSITYQDVSDGLSNPKTITRTFTFTNCNETQNVTQIIIINDSTKPTITCPADISQTVETGANSAIITIPPATFIDNCPGGSITNNYNSGGEIANDNYPVGKTIVTFTATDAAGNTDFCSMTVTVTLNVFQYSIIPNPNRGIFSFRIDSNPEPELTLKLINVIGQVIETRTIVSSVVNHTEWFNVPHLSKGIYLLEISSDEFHKCEKIEIQ
ncbi:MAG: HYR domain-containing protein [Mariniphaga sp.]|nr:HYR domain-containing protein [Mariniphaga sp.]